MTAPRRTVVVSAVNLVEGGTLAVLRQCLRSLREELGDAWRIVALVHDRALAPEAGVDYLEFPAVKGSYLRRIRFEYWQCRRLSRELRADLWFALHDMTPVVQARRQAVYCHNPHPFYRLSWREIRLAPGLLPSDLLYGWFYRFNIRRNDAVVVQQDWLRDEFRRRFGARRVIVAHPVSPGRPGAPRPVPAAPLFVYPALPRVFKNLELIGQAVALLESDARWNGRVVLTTDGTENAYARVLKTRFGALRTLEFAGLQTREQMDALYRQADCLLFPSRLETWGMPLTEAQSHGLAILAADLPYAHESVGEYPRAAYFGPADAATLAARMLAFQDGSLAFAPQARQAIAPPFAADWPALVRLLVDGL